MKIAFIVSGFPKLSETFILNQITGLLDLGHEVDIFAQFNSKEGKVHQDVETYHLMERVHYFNMPSSRLKRVLKAIYLLVVNLRKAPVAILRSLNIFRYGKEALSLRLFYALLAFIRRRTTYDVIHCHFGPNGIIGVFLKESGMKGKIITSFHGYDFSAYISQNGEGVYKDLFKKGDLFMANSEHTKNRLISLGCDERKIVKLPMGLDSDQFRFRPRKLELGQKIKILTVARLVEKKGIEYSIKAVANVMQKHQNIEYKIAGDGPLRKDLERLILDLGVKDKVHLLGWLERNEVIRVMDESHIFILSSVTAKNGDQEGQGVVLQEVQAMGLPVLATLHNGIPEGVVDGRSGFLVPERDVDALAEKLEYLIEHPELWVEMGRFGRKFVEENYEIKKLTRKLVEIYEECLAKGKEKA